MNLDRGCPHCHSIPLDSNGLTYYKIKALDCEGSEGAFQLFTCGCHLVLEGGQWVEKAPCVPDEGWYEPLMGPTDMIVYRSKYGRVKCGTMSRGCKWHTDNDNRVGYDTLEEVIEAAKREESEY